MEIIKLTNEYEIRPLCKEDYNYNGIEFWSSLGYIKIKEVNI